MTHKEREIYAQKLMAVLEGEAPGLTVMESGELEALWPTVATLSPNFCPWRWLTSADRRDRAALRTLRAEVLQASPFEHLPRGAGVDPLGFIVALSHVDRFQDHPEHPLKREFPQQVWDWVYRYGRIELRATSRWLNRGYGYADDIVCYACQGWVMTILLGREDLLSDSRLRRRLVVDAL